MHPVLRLDHRTDRHRKPVRLRDAQCSRLPARSCLLDLNYLFHRRGVSLVRADAAACEPARQAHLELFRAYGARIGKAGA
jgi:hypothetical protein